MGLLGFFIDMTLPHYGPGADSASNRNQYHRYPLDSKGGRCVEMTTLLPLCADCVKILGVSTSRPVMGYLYLYHDV